ncbi:hypothetical protein, partial [Mycolicibacterium insubricum]|uniref:hypothetical protein n=1 Tax=Mycolicibacterium insubricum TaxID=444597 RepID=UPI0021F3AB26
IAIPVTTTLGRPLPVASGAMDLAQVRAVLGVDVEATATHGGPDRTGTEQLDAFRRRRRRPTPPGSVPATSTRCWGCSAIWTPLSRRRAG